MGSPWWVESPTGVLRSAHWNMLTHKRLWAAEPEAALMRVTLSGYLESRSLPGIWVDPNRAAHLNTRSMHCVSNQANRPARESLTCSARATPVGAYHGGLGTGVGTEETGPSFEPLTLMS